MCGSWLTRLTEVVMASCPAVLHEDLDSRVCRGQGVVDGQTVRNGQVVDLFRCSQCGHRFTLVEKTKEGHAK